MRPMLIVLFLLSRLPSESSVPSWRAEIETAAAAIRDGQYQAAEARLRAALRLAGDDGQSAATWNNLGSLYVDLGRHREAENAFRRSLRLWDKYEGAGAEAKANALNSLGGLLVDQGRIKEAERHIAESLALRRAKPTALDVTPALNNMALIKLAQRRYRDAQVLLSEALAICQAAGRTCTAGSAPIHHNSAQALAGLGRDREAVAAYLASIAFGEEAFGAGHPRLGWTYFELASLSMKVGDDELAASLFEKILTMQENYRLGPHPLIMSAMERYGKLLVRQGRRTKGEVLLRRARAMKTELADRERIERSAVDLDTLRASMGRVAR